MLGRQEHPGAVTMFIVRGSFLLPLHEGRFPFLGFQFYIGFEMTFALPRAEVRAYKYDFTFASAAEFRQRFWNVGDGKVPVSTRLHYCPGIAR